MTENAPPVAIYDLHLHTCWSYDATARPESYFECARELGVRCIAVTEHHVLDSLEDVLAVARRYPDVKAVPAAELTVTTSIGGVDLLCYGFPEKPSPALARVLDSYHAWQRAAGEAISRGMQALGHDFSDADRLQLLESYRPAEAIRVQGNTHVMGGLLRDTFVQQGFISGPKDYNDLITRMREKVPLPPYPAVDRVVRAVKEAGVVVAIAHPFRYFGGCDIRKMDALREECGFDGIECAHSNVPPEYTERYRAYCEQHGLFSVGGSDSHHEDLARQAFARHCGKPEWLDELLGRLG